MSKIYISEKKLQEIFNTRFKNEQEESFYEWLSSKVDSNEIEFVEFDNYDISKLDYKPIAKLIGENGSIFNIMGIANKALKECGMAEKANEMRNKVMTKAKNYNEALLIIMNYVEVY